MDRDALDHLADALVEDIAAASGDDLLAEVEEDFGDAGILAVAFDEVLAGVEALTAQQSQDEAIGRLADALHEDIAAASPEALLREVAEDYGDGRALAAEFDRAVFGGAASSSPAGVETSIAEEVRRQRMARSAAAANSPARLRTAFAAVLDWLAAPLHARTAVAAFAALVLFVIVAPRLLERSADPVEKSIVRTTLEHSAKRSSSPPSVSPSPSALPVSPPMPEQDQMPAKPAPRAAAAPSPSDAKQEAAGPPAGAPPPMAAMRRMAPQMKAVEEERKRRDADRDVAPSRGRVAASLPAAQPPSSLAVPPQAANANQPEQIRQAQIELNRLGCFTGKPDGLLNDETQKAVQAFRTSTGGPVTETGISNELIADLRRQAAGICNAAPPVAAGAARPPAAAAPAR